MDCRDGTQRKLDAQTLTVTNSHGSVGGRTGRFRKDKHDGVEWASGAEPGQSLMRDVYRTHHVEGLGDRRIARRLADERRHREGGKPWLETRIDQLLKTYVYCGYTAGLTAVRGIYNGLRDGELVKLDRTDTDYLNKTSFPVLYRPPEETYRQELSAVSGFLPAEVG